MILAGKGTRGSGTDHMDGTGAVTPMPSDLTKTPPWIRKRSEMTVSVTSGDPGSEYSPSGNNSRKTWRYLKDLPRHLKAWGAFLTGVALLISALTGLVVALHT